MMSLSHSFSLSLSLSVSLADDLWVFPVSGCVSVCVHTAASQSSVGPDQTADTALLWPQVIHTPHTGYAQITILQNGTLIRI